MSVLVVAEKPSVARDIAKVLGATTRRDGYLEGNNYIVSWAVGHLVTLCEPEDYANSYKKWALSTLPIIPQPIQIKPIPKTKKQFNLLKKLMNSPICESIICATDSGREGELIFRYIYLAAGCKKSVSRLWISSLTDTAIKKGLANLKPASDYDTLYYSAKCRSEADWLVGINASRAFTLKYDSLLSIGRVQTPTLSLIVQRQEEIDRFKPEDYWEVEAVFDAQPHYSGIWFELDVKETRIKTPEAAQALADKINQKPAKVLSVKKEKKSKPHPLLFDLTELQREANRSLGFTAKKTLSIAQDLYEKRKIITYPRTDSKHITKDMVPGIKVVFSKLRGLQPEFIAYILEKETIPVTKRIVDDKKVSDHHAIIPTGKMPQQLTKDEQAVFNLILLRFIAAFYPPYQYNSCLIITECEKEQFATKGTQVLQKGWMEVLAQQQSIEEKNIPPIKKGTTSTVLEANILKKTTSPPKPYTEATLLSAMENAGRFVEEETLKEHLKDSGLGTPATRAAIIERLLDVQYIKRQKKNLIPTEKGIKLIQVVPEELRSPKTTAKWEKGLSSISKGTMDPKRFDSSIIKYVQYLVNEAKKSNRGDVVFPQEERGAKRARGKAYGKCPACGGDILENSKAYYCNRWKRGCHFTLWKNQLDRYGASLKNDTVKKLLEDKRVDGFAVTLPQTGEKGTCSLILKPDFSGNVEIMGFTRQDISQETSPAVSE